MSEAPSQQPQSFELPKPQPSAETAGVSPEVKQAAPVSAEKSAAAPMPTVDPAQLAAPASDPSLAAPGQTQQANAGAGLQADDADLIEKEWVVKAKKIVEQTADDPYKQKQELSAFSAEYLKKRYGKDIALEE